MPSQTLATKMPSAGSAEEVMLRLLNEFLKQEHREINARIRIVKKALRLLRALNTPEATAVLNEEAVGTVAASRVNRRAIFGQECSSILTNSFTPLTIGEICLELDDRTPLLSSHSDPLRAVCIGLQFLAEHGWAMATEYEGIRK